VEGEDKLDFFVFLVFFAVVVVDRLGCRFKPCPRRARHRKNSAQTSECLCLCRRLLFL